MLNIYYGSESADKEKFMFQNIKGKTLLIVPDQFSLQAERDAFFYLGKKSLMDLRIVDFSALGHKVVNEVGGAKLPLIDKYGRHMLLTRIIGSMEDRLNIYKGLSGKTSFIDMMNGLISEMKRFEVDPRALAAAAAALDEKSFLKYKLEDIEKIYNAYQQAIEDKYLDSEDYITFYGEKILHSRMIAESEVWIYGFDTFTPKNLLVIERLLKTAEAVNIVMTYDGRAEGETGSEHMTGVTDRVGELQDAVFLTGADRDELFALTGYVTEILKNLAEELNEECRMLPIQPPDGPLRKNIWNTAGWRTFTDESTADAGSLPITMVEASNIYSEAERAAAYILTLVRDQGYKFGDILVVCNDTGAGGAALRRIFIRWGIPVFMDKKRKVLHHPAVSFLLAFMEIVAKGYKDDAVMRLLKSGLLAVSVDDAELLENYIYEYKIRGSLWQIDFSRGSDKYSDEERDRLNIIRRSIVDITETARNDIGRRNTAAEKIKGLYKFLKDDFMMAERLEAVMEQQEAFGLAEGAAETAQSWNVLCGILDQIVETIGEEQISNEQLAALMTAGFEAVEIGLVPASSDSVIIGTLQRTRLSRIRALLVVGANEGVLPLERTEEGLLSEREKGLLEELSLEMSKKDSVLRQEERLAIYRIFSLPEEKLYISCSGADGAGEERRPSAVFNALKTLMQNDPSWAVLGDIEDDAGVFDMLVSKDGTLSYMTKAFRAGIESGDMDYDWLQVMNWYAENDAQDLDKIRRGMTFDNRLEAMGARFADALYRGDKQNLEVSASRLEKYSSCPFAHFIGYGLRAEEARMYEMGAREIGDVYHECLMKFSHALTPDADNGIEVDDPRSPWMNVSREECRAAIEKILTEEMYGYREGLLALSKAEEYRTERITEICSQIAWSLVEQVRKGRIKSMFFEKPFGRGCELPAVRVDIGDQNVLIQGKIDRVDILRGDTEAAGSNIDGARTGDSDAVRIVDYKTGADSVNADYFRSGYKLQLMVYLKAAMQGGEAYTNDAVPGGGLRPAGVFHFKIKDLDTDADAKRVAGGETDLQQRLEEAYKLEGIVLNDPRLIGAMDKEMESASQVIPVKQKKDGSLAASAGGTLISDEDFRELYRQVEEQAERTCREICAGNIEIQPKRERIRDMEGGYRNSCKYCSYKSICMFDTAFEGCSFKQV